jgi:hypothetical protein
MPGPEEPQHQSHNDFHDADAVCEACNYVNPEGTIICKQCGNNLRDQRMRRIEIGMVLASEGQRPQTLLFLRGALTVLAILIIVWAAFNAEAFFNRIFGLTPDELNPSASYFEGEEAPFFDALAQEMEAAPFTEEELANLPAQGRELRPGRYLLKALVREGGETAEGDTADGTAEDSPEGATEAPVTESEGEPIGQAMVSQAEEGFFYVAELDGIGEVRGIIDAESSLTRIIDLDAGFQPAHGRRTISTASGKATINPDGTFTVRGQSDTSDGMQSAVLYFVK